MPLSSKLFRDNKQLEAAAVQDQSHITLGSRGEHVRLIQRALGYLGIPGVSGREYAEATYGPTTANAVLRYKTMRGIINRSYQSAPDNIVGKMTIAVSKRCRHASSENSMAPTVLLSVNDGDWNVWGERFVKRQPLQRVQHTISPNAPAAVAKDAVIKAARAAGAHGVLIISVGHGTTVDTPLHPSSTTFRLAFAVRASQYFLTRFTP
jgi:hypothetical protein